MNSESCAVVSNSLQTRGLLQARILEWVAFLFSKGSSQHRDQIRSPALQADSLPTELSGKPKTIAFNIVKIQVFQFLFSISYTRDNCTIREVNLVIPLPLNRKSGFMMNFPFIIRSILSDMRIATAAFFCMLCFSILSLSVYVCL